LNQIICENKVTEMKALESLSTDEYYQTLSTYCRIVDERNEAIDPKHTSSAQATGNSNNKRNSLRK
jgi:hypothetical protein